MRREVFAMQQPEVFRDFLIAAHRVSDSRAGIDAGQSRTDQRKEYGQRFNQHESLAMSAQQRIAENDHHVAHAVRLNLWRR